MFKTIHECRLDLVGHSVMKAAEEYWLEGSPYINSEQQDQDFMPCSAARVSFGKEDKTGHNFLADVKLMKYLADHNHMTPFEHQTATFLVEVPLFIRSQIHRHRTFAYNEISRRYTDENLEFWIPDEWRGQAKSNRQASDGVVTKPGIETMFKDSVAAALVAYNYYIDEYGLSREQARAILPQSLLTKFYMTGNLRNWCHFLELRLDEHSQYEVRVVAERIKEELTKLWPNSMAALM